MKEYLTQGFVPDDERLKGKNVFGADYFDDLLDRIREIRLSERRYYQKITDILFHIRTDIRVSVLIDAQRTARMFDKKVQQSCLW